MIWTIVRETPRLIITNALYQYNIVIKLFIYFDRFLNIQLLFTREHIYTTPTITTTKIIIILIIQKRLTGYYYYYIINMSHVDI